MINENSPDVIFEVSWEVCNKVGGIHTVITTKATSLLERFNDNLVFIGPDIWMESKDHPTFIEDDALYAPWRKKAHKNGLSVKIGRWNIPGQPMVFLINFSNYISQKDQIFSQLWEAYKLDSLSGHWDYVEPVLFGYAAGKVIDSFIRFNLVSTDKVIAQFHEWMTGAGVLYLKEAMPQVGTVFTTHATVLGRCLAGNGWPLYEKLQTYNGDALAKEFNVVSKQSIEKISAREADVFTTVSQITSNECAQFLGKLVDAVTPNGFENSFVPEGDNFLEKRKQAKAKLIHVAESLSGCKMGKNPLIVATSGRYEFGNKGYDVFIDSLGEMNSSSDLQTEILAFILVPANNYGPRKDLLARLSDEKVKGNLDQPYLTHNLHDADYDPIIKRLRENNIRNSEEDKVKVFFVPSYLNGNDGIFNLEYYDILIGMDITVFASYYEPWGYTPLESIAFGIPTITTTLAGFGLWMKEESDNGNDSVFVIERTDSNQKLVMQSISNRLLACATWTPKKKEEVMLLAKKTSQLALWKNLVDHYAEMYKVALEKVSMRKDSFVEIQTATHEVKIQPNLANEPTWRNIEVQAVIPEKLACLSKLVQNLWWSWNYRAIELFKMIDIELWREKHGNPIALLDSISSGRLAELEKDDIFIEKYNHVCTEFREYMEKSPEKKQPKIAYFSMEYGIHDNLKIFSGGLGILAGDYLKEASDNNVDMIGIGLLYRYGYFRQELSVSGEQQAVYDAQDFNKMPITMLRDENGKPMEVFVNFPGRKVVIRVWRADVGRISLLLLDTDHDMNITDDRTITHQLYGGNNEYRFKQEMILGIGGIRVLNDLGIRPDLYHCNEGHAAFISLERLLFLRTKRQLKFKEALEIIRASTLFTTHTPVPAGHDQFDENLMRTYMAHYPSRLKVSWEEMMHLGQMTPGEKFSMSYLAVNSSQEVNGVSKLHGEVSRKMFTKLWGGYFSDESHIGHVTNGVHYHTWVADSWKVLYEKEFGEGFLQNLSDSTYWEKIYKVSDAAIWDQRMYQRTSLIEYIRDRGKKNWVKRYELPKSVISVVNNIDEKALTIGFARRFATYKRAHLLFMNMERLSAILNNPEMPVQLLLAGKAHPNDKGGQDLIKYIVEISKRPEFLGKIIFLENYDIDLAKRMVQGVDIWLNTPTRPLEASGTSGMKAVMNGALHFSVLDGWWVEGYHQGAGWALSEERTYQSQDFQDELDAETIYSMLENEIVPMYYERDSNDVPCRWVGFIKKSIARIAPMFTTTRMMEDYYSHFYEKLGKRAVEMRSNDYELAIQIAEWKETMQREWNGIEVISADIPDLQEISKNTKADHFGIVKIDLKNLSPDDIGVELIIAKNVKGGDFRIVDCHPGELINVKGKITTFRLDISTVKPGAFSYAVRLFAKNDQLVYRQDFPLVKWI